MMVKTAAQYMQENFTQEEQAEIETRLNEYVEQKMTLRELRKNCRLSQEVLAEQLGWRQGDLSKFERKSDAYLSTIKHYIEGLGAKLELSAVFPDGHVIKITRISEVHKSPS